ncbi:aminotransferase class III-fold pyridoxal phosphate-dependent enzyme [Corynebacterium bovis]|uniref:aminotransferase class III-fold pyridoxal phosphate-dependent enzyme n=1 Tax=Corynebacterium bovis TaxID=36808 RepID=UPI00244D52BE|nr:aminotransferase class III-fold pyridoxal phosphate-dependent enzyme [Corynebacterium bovis]MDH2456073.1 aminotransferase class III-fold pyridoxal phosphate-dependent enzyme [Corynebacterium bovis]
MTSTTPSPSDPTAPAGGTPATGTAPTGPDTADRGPSFTDSRGVPLTPGSEEALAAERRVREDDRNHVFHSWAAQATIDPMPVAAAQGAHFYAYDGTRYLDLGSQLVSANLGHNHPDLVEAIRRQAGRVTNLNPAFADDVRGELARRLVDRAQGDFSHVFFTNGGADAVEHAIRMARLHTGRRRILSAFRSYHGATGSAIMATGEARRHGNPTTDGDIEHFYGPFLHHSEFYSDSEEQECERALTHLEHTIQSWGPKETAAVLIESVVGSSGVIVPPDGYLRGVREICDRYDLLYIADEVMVGFGRTGTLFAYEHGGPEVRPDLVTFAKGVNSGYVPLGGVLISPAVYGTFAERPYPGGLTYSGHPLACAPGVAALDVYERDGIFERVADLGERVLRPALERIGAEHPSVADVRGRGFFWALEFSDGKGGAPDLSGFAAELKAAGIWPMVSGPRLHIAPPLITAEEDLVAALEAVDRAVSGVDAQLS